MRERRGDGANGSGGFGFTGVLGRHQETVHTTLKVFLRLVCSLLGMRGRGLVLVRGRGVERRGDWVLLLVVVLVCE